MNFLHFTLLFFLLSWNISSTFTIQSPPELKKLIEAKHPKGIPYSVANYGDVPFGKPMTGTIVVGSYL